MKTSFSLIALLAAPAASLCPFGFDKPSAGQSGQYPSALAGSATDHPHGLAQIASLELAPPPQPTPEYTEAMHSLDIAAVQSDLKTLMTNSQDWWPADYGNYGPFFIRLAWHCSGTYRATDGRGGCSGGRQRFEPEASWEDNTNLDKARRLLWPIKEKYGLGLSWGDLFIMAGTTAIESMGGPTLGVCVGRVDDEDGARSVGLDECVGGVNGKCEAPMGSTTKELIYVNPEGPMGQPIPDQSAVEVRDTFKRMGMNDHETVALIGGGHTFGKSHGACKSKYAEGMAGLSPEKTTALGLDPSTQAWQGECGTGKGADTWTSGIEGSWTTNPTAWDNSYFRNLLNYGWHVEEGPGGKHQWMVSETYGPQAPSSDGTGRQDIMMLTTDMALLNDPASKYQELVKEFATDAPALDEAFAAAWHKLTTRAFGSEKAPRCVTKVKATLRPGATAFASNICSATK